MPYPIIEDCERTLDAAEAIISPSGYLPQLVVRPLECLRELVQVRRSDGEIL